MLEQPQTGLISRFYRQVENRLKNDTLARGQFVDKLTTYSWFESQQSHYIVSYIFTEILKKSTILVMTNPKPEGDFRLSSTAKDKF